MGRPRNPDKVQEISGAWKKNPQRRRVQSEAVKNAAGIGKPPDEWVKDAETNGRCKELLRTWNQILAQDVLGVLNISHRILIENTCHLMYKIRRASQGYGRATSGDFAQVKANLAAMGMTPADSSRVAESVRIPERGGTSSQSKPGSGWGEYVG
jgi:hypothetical protein